MNIILHEDNRALYKSYTTIKFNKTRKGFNFLTKSFFLYDEIVITKDKNDINIKITLYEDDYLVFNRNYIDESSVRGCIDGLIWGEGY